MIEKVPKKNEIIQVGHGGFDNCDMCGALVPANSIVSPTYYDDYDGDDNSSLERCIECGTPINKKALSTIMHQAFDLKVMNKLSTGERLHYIRPAPWGGNWIYITNRRVLSTKESKNLVDIFFSNKADLLENSFFIEDIVKVSDPEVVRYAHFTIYWSVVKTTHGSFRFRFTSYPAAKEFTKKLDLTTKIVHFQKQLLYRKYGTLLKN